MITQGVDSAHDTRHVPLNLPLAGKNLASGFSTPNNYCDLTLYLHLPHTSLGLANLNAIKFFLLILKKYFFPTNRYNSSSLWSRGSEKVRESERMNFFLLFF